MNRLLLLVSLLAVACTEGNSNSKFLKLENAILESDYQEVKTLLKNGVNVNYQNNGITPLMSASGVYQKKPEYILRLREQGIKSSENTLLVELLLINGAKTNLQNIEGRTALEFAVVNNWLGTAWLLLKNGSNPNHVNELGWSPVNYAKDHCLKQMVKLLVDFGGVEPENEEKCLQGL